MDGLQPSKPIKCDNRIIPSRRDFDRVRRRRRIAKHLSNGQSRGIARPQTDYPQGLASLQVGARITYVKFLIGNAS